MANTKNKTLTLMLATIAFSWSVASYAAITPEEEAAVKETYLKCDQLTTCGAFLGGDDAATCSFAHETLLKEVFDGSFDKLLEWWKANKLSCEGVAEELGSEE